MKFWKRKQIYGNEDLPILIIHGIKKKQELQGEIAELKKKLPRLKRKLKQETLSEEITDRSF